MKVIADMATLPENYERDLKKVTLRACAALLQKTHNPKTRLLLQFRVAADWQVMLERGGYGRYDEAYIEEAIQELPKLSRPSCPDCGRYLVALKWWGEQHCERCGESWDHEDLQR